MQSEEWIDVIGGACRTKREVHLRGDWHVAAHVWVVTPDLRVLLQHRAAVKENWPGYWDVSAAGHLSSGETPIEAAMRETFEEIGLRIEASELVHIGTTREQRVLREGTYLDNEVHEIFVVRREVDLAALTLQPEEVDDVMLVPLSELDAVSPLVPHDEEYGILKGLPGIAGQHLHQHREEVILLGTLRPWAVAIDGLRDVKRADEIDALMAQQNESLQLRGTRLDGKRRRCDRHVLAPAVERAELGEEDGVDTFSVFHRRKTSFHQRGSE